MLSTSRVLELPSIPSAQALRLIQVPAPNPDAEPHYVYCSPAVDCPTASALSAASRVPPPASAAVMAPPAAASIPDMISPRPSSRSAMDADIHGLALAFGYKSAVLSSVDRQLLKHWLQAQPDRSGDHYVVLVHTDDSGWLSRRLAQQRRDVVLAALRDLGMSGMPELRQVHDPIRRLVVVAHHSPVASAAASPAANAPVPESNGAAPSAAAPADVFLSPPPSPAIPLVPSSLPAAPTPSEDSSTEPSP
jgi:hypothetical protein